MDLFGGATFFSLLREAVYGASPLLGSWKLAGYLFVKGGWVFLLAGVVAIAWHHWMLYIQEDFSKKNRRWVFLAIDIPKDNVQSPKAVENIFAHLAGGHGSLTKLEKYWYGATQDYFSLEIVSIEGYVQYVIRTVERFRDLVESAIYGQYPEAEITEIEDYTIGYPTRFPDEKYDMYGTEFVYVENEALPIRTYPEFEHQMTQEFKDPMLAILETMSKIGPGEQLWWQIIIVPIDNQWKRPIIAEMKKLMGEEKKTKGIFGGVWGEAQKFRDSATNQFAGGSGILEASASQTDTRLTGLLMMSPYERERIDAMARKVKKIGYLTKIRSIYIATKERYNVSHGREALIGAIKQFNTEDINSLKPDTKHVGVHAQYFFKDWRKNWKRRKIMDRYKTRNWGYGRKAHVMNIEELASLWHFPARTENEPMRHMVQRTEFKHTPPPSILPYAPESDTASSTEALKDKDISPPDNLPVA